MDSLVKIPELLMNGPIKSEVVEQLIIKQVVEELRKVNLSKFRLSNQLTRMIMQMVETTCIEHQTTKINKKQCVLNILAEYHTLSQAELEKVSNEIEDIYRDKRFKKIVKPIIHRICKKISKCIIKKKQ